MVRIVLPYHLKILAQIEGNVEVDVAPPVTQRTVLDALEVKFPMLKGTIRDHVSQKRRSHLRLYACELDLSHESPDTPLPAAVAEGKEPYIVMTAVSGG